ncbi:MAG TPA: glucan biosynthesis protein [Polyangiaceae bacterium]|nr:glucan biosynthesis protein [Polyangiaceae bacterium]
MRFESTCTRSTPSGAQSTFPKKASTAQTKCGPRNQRMWPARAISSGILVLGCGVAQQPGSSPMIPERHRQAVTSSSSVAVHGEKPAGAAHPGPEYAGSSSVSLADFVQQLERELPQSSWRELVERAHELSKQSARPPRKIELPPSLKGLRYDDFRGIRFRPERSLWRGGAGQFEAQFFHPGFYFQEVVDVFEVKRTATGADSRRVEFSTDQFSYEGIPNPPRGAALGFTGFRLHAPLNQTQYRDELVAFLGASYFRPLGKDTVYGLSARGLAMDFGAPTSEEFPRFTEFYLLEPAANQRQVWVLALLESRRATGAYAFRFEPGTMTHVDITAQLFLRESVSVLGAAPLTSMYLFGEDAPGRFGDFRPEVHDSDGLAIWGRDGEWLFRPLRNPPRTTTSSLRADQPRGFGLVQRDRSFDSYQDLEARYQDRPSVWVEPISGFEGGAVRLLEISTELETDDNIVAAFVPDRTSLEPLLRYRLHVGRQSPFEAAGGRVVATRLAKTKNGQRFLVDFRGAALEARDGVPPPEVRCVASATGGRIVEQHVEKNPYLDGYRASFEVTPEPGAKDVELRAFLRAKDVVTETWSYLWQPTR